MPTAAADPLEDPPALCVGVIGVADAPAGAGQSANAHGEFVHVGLADNDGAGVAQARDEGRVAGG